MDRKTAEEEVQWMRDSGIQDELVDFSYLFVRSALNRLLTRDPGWDIYSDSKAIRHNLLGQSSAVSMLDVMRRSNHKIRDWPEGKVEEVSSKTILIYAQLLKFIAGMIDEQDAGRKAILVPFRMTIGILAKEINAELKPS